MFQAIGALHSAQFWDTQMHFHKIGQTGVGATIPAHAQVFAGKCQCTNHLLQVPKHRSPCRAGHVRPIFAKITASPDTGIGALAPQFLGFLVWALQGGENKNPMVKFRKSLEPHRKVWNHNVKKFGTTTGALEPARGTLEPLGTLEPGGLWNQCEKMRNGQNSILPRRPLQRKVILPPLVEI